MGGASNNNSSKKGKNLSKKGGYLKYTKRKFNIDINVFIL